MTEMIGKPRVIDSRHRITLPPKVLRLLNLKPNDEVFFRIEQGKLIMGKALVKYEFIDKVKL